MNCQAPNEAMQTRTHAEVALAAALQLLSSSAARGISAAKTHALLLQLQRLAADEALHSALRSTCASLCAQWQETAQRLDGGSVDASSSLH